MMYTIFGELKCDILVLFLRVLLLARPRDFRGLMAHGFLYGSSGLLSENLMSAQDGSLAVKQCRHSSLLSSKALLGKENKCARFLDKTDLSSNDESLLQCD